MIDSVTSFLVNGESATDVSIMDRGLAYGQGVFETIRVVDGKPVLWNAHLARLERGCRRLKIPLAKDISALESEVERLAEGCAEAVLTLSKR